MIRGLYASASGMDVRQAKIENIANNLTNATTPGYKREDVLVQSFPELVLIQQGGPRRSKLPEPVAPRRIGTTGNGALVAEVSTEYTPGAVRETGNPVDLMIKGPGFFAVRAPLPEEPDRVCYTRNGAFKVDQEGYLVTSNGYRVLGEDGEIKVGEAGTSSPPKFIVSPDGTINDGGQAIGKLRLAEFQDQDVLSKDGGGLFVDSRGEAGPAERSVVSQGFLEMSNVNVVNEMVDLIEVMRSYEAGQRLIQSHDEILAKAVNQVGNLR